MKSAVATLVAVLVLSITASADDKGWKEMSAKDLEDAIAKKAVTVVDNNGPDVYAKNHVPGAINASPKDFPESILPKDKAALVVFYCANEKCHACHVGADRAVSLGYTNVRILPIGIAGWVAGKHAVETGAPAMGAGSDVAKEPTSPLDFTVKDIEGNDVKLSDFKGKVVIIVNVASKCGNTPQYKDLEATYGKYKEKGLVVLGFPANEFGGQEPGTDKEIKEFCTATYKVTFPMFSKVVVKGDGICPLYKFLTDEKLDKGFSGEIGWNFAKFIVGRDGKVVKRLDPKTKVTADEVVKAIEAELGKK
ncbi:MAG: redoxin domain-containing protein [Planctomycetes bacterium]|nr:redoxin domain-containing protein [Planctomycetota bacterium]